MAIQPTPYPTGINTLNSVSPQPAPQPTQPQAPASTLWNQAWNVGYNNANSTSNPYSGQGRDGYDFSSAYVQGQQAYLNDLAKRQTTTTKPPPGGGGGNGQVLGAATSASEGQFVDPYAGLRNDISSGWDSYLSSLDNQLNSLSGQRTSQEGIAQSQFNQGLNTLDLQKTQGLSQLGTQREQATQNQAKNLRDLAGNIKNSFMAGNVYLGSRGAGDSSAANQYSFALTKLGSQQRGDIMNNTSNILNDIGNRETNLNNIYNTEKNNLQEGLNQQIQGIAQWYSNAVQNLQMQKAQGQLSKSQDLQSLSREILNRALGELSSIQQQAQNRQAALDSWAISNAKNLSEVRTNLSAVASPAYQLPQAQSITGSPQFTSDGRIFIPSGYGNNSNEKKNIFGF